MKFSNKLSFAIFITGMTVLILLLFITYKFNYNSIIKSQFTYTKSIADEVSDDIDQLLCGKVKIALTLANTPIIKTALETSNFSYDSLSEEKRKESIRLLNEKWKTTTDPMDSFIQRFTENEVSHSLKKQQAILKGEYGEIFLTNKFGALVASTSMLSTFSHGHKYWWLGSFNNGEGAVFFDDRGYDDSVGGYVLGLVVPIKKGTEIIGILKCNLNILSSLSKLISDADDKLFAKFKLSRSGGMVVFEDGYEPLSTQIHDYVLKNLGEKNSEVFIFTDAVEEYLVGFSEIKLTTGEKGYGFGGTFESIDHKKGNTGESWYVLCYRQMSVVRSSIIELVKSIIFIGTAIILVLMLVSHLFARKITKPLDILDKATQKIGKRDFKYRIEIRQKDEFGNLGRSFNRMAGRLLQTTTSIELLENEVAERKLAEKKFARMAQEWQTTFDTTNDAIFLLDKDMNIQRANKNAEQLFGCSGMELSGNHCWEIVHGTDQPIPECPNIKAIQSLRRESTELQIGENWFRVTVDPILDNSGGYIGGVHIATDITKQRLFTDKLQKSEEKFKFLAENMGDIVWTLDMDFNATYVSPSVEKVLGYPVEERMQQKMEDMVTPEAFEQIMALFMEELEREKKSGVDPDRSVTIDVEYFHKNGSIVWMENIVKAIRDESNTIVGMYGVSHNITERKKTDKEKEKLISELKNALKEIKTLSGLIPICAMCKKIRDDKGYWNLLESYIEKHSDALFSHSMCPECSDKLYGNEDWYIEMKNKKRNNKD